MASQAEQAMEQKHTPDEVEEFTLCSDFAKRTSQFMSISDSEAAHKISMYEDADIADTL